MGVWYCALAATALMALAMGARSAFGLFVSPLNTATGIGLAGIGLAVAFGQLALGVAQPVVGWLADRYGARRLIAWGALALAFATVTVIAADTLPWMIVAMVAIAVAGSAVGSNTLLMAEVGRRVPIERRALAFGLVSAGGSAGQLVLGPATQATIESFGWVAAIWATALAGLVAVPLARAFDDGQPAERSPAPSPQSDEGVAGVLRSIDFWLIAGTFGACGFHVAFLTTHMPGVIDRCGLPSSLAGIWLALLGTANIAGSLFVGWWLQRSRTHTVLIAIFALRALSIGALLVLPVSSGAMLAFAIAMGLSYMALLPAVSQQIAERFGTARLATLFGIVALVHQVGGFAGAWLGGLAAEATGGDTMLWSIDIALALAAIGLQCRLAWVQPAPGVAGHSRAIVLSPGIMALRPARRRQPWASAQPLPFVSRPPTAN